MSSHNFSSKNWQTNIGAFGTTEKKFASLKCDMNENPGPGSYKDNSFIPKKFGLKQVRGQKAKVNMLKESSFFSSTSTRTFDDSLIKNTK